MVPFLFCLKAKMFFQKKNFYFTILSTYYFTRKKALLYIKALKIHAFS